MKIFAHNFNPSQCWKRRFVFQNPETPDEHPVNTAEEQKEWKEALLSGEKGIDELVQEFSSLAEKQKKEGHERVNFVKNNLKDFFQKVGIDLPKDVEGEINTLVTNYETTLSDSTQTFYERMEDLQDEGYIKNDASLNKYDELAGYENVFGSDDIADAPEGSKTKEVYNAWKEVKDRISELGEPRDIFEKKELENLQKTLAEKSKELKSAVEKDREDENFQAQKETFQGLTEKLQNSVNQEQIQEQRRNLWEAYQNKADPRYIQDIQNISNIRDADGDVNMKALNEQIKKYENGLPRNYQETLSFLQNESPDEFFAADDTLIQALKPEHQDLFKDSSPKDLVELKDQINDALSIKNLHEMYDKMEGSVEIGAPEKTGPEVANKTETEKPQSQELLREKSAEEIYKLVESKVKPDSIKEGFDPQKYNQAEWNQKITEMIDVENTEENIRKIQELIGSQPDGNFGPHSALSLFKLQGGSIDASEHREWVSKFNHDYITQWDQKSVDVLGYNKQEKQLVKTENLETEKEGLSVTKLQDQLEGVAKKHGISGVEISTDLYKVGDEYRFGINSGEEAFIVSMNTGKNEVLFAKAVQKGSLKPSSFSGSITPAEMIKNAEEYLERKRTKEERSTEEKEKGLISINPEDLAVADLTIEDLEKNLSILKESLEKINQFSKTLDRNNETHA